MANDDYEAAAKKLLEAGHAMSHLDEAQLLGLGHEALGIIVGRTGAGLDVDGKPFKAYSPEYAKLRAAKGLSATTVDLARTGHMLGSLTVASRPGEVEIAFNASHEAKKAATHNFGATSQVSVRAHSRRTAVDVKGRRVSGTEIKRDKKRKKDKRRLFYRDEKVSTHKRQMNTPKREFFDIKLDAEWQALSESAGVKLQGNIEKVFAK